MQKVSVIIPTYNRPELVKKAVGSVLDQTYIDYEIIVVDDGLKKRAEHELKEFINNGEITYIQHKESKGGGAARNTGIRAAKGEYIAFLDDDDQWKPKKLEIQMSFFKKASEETGFSFSAVTNVFDNHEFDTQVDEGERDYSELSFRRFNGFLTVTLVIKKSVFDEIGVFDESLPSHQDPELILRIAQKYKGIGVNKPLVWVNMKSGRDHIGGDFARRIAGREKVLEKHYIEFTKRPKILAKHYFQLGLLYRDSEDKKNAGDYFLKAWSTNKSKIVYFLHFIKIKIGL
ncbi:MAG: glycosyltransferase [Candidatus Pacebacteria bacterium]|nr:glycosyltransferase [Candidatus Paceibacterota bacterium]